MSRVNILTHSVTYLLGIVLLNVGNFLLVPIYTRVLLTSEFGRLEILFGCIDVLNMIFSAGLGITSLSLYSARDEKREKDAVISTAIICCFTLSVIGSLIFQILARPLSIYFFHSSQYLTLFRLASVLLLGQMVSAIPMAYVQAEMKSRLYITISIFMFIITTSLSLLFVLIFSLKIVGILLAHIIVNLLLSSFMVAYVLVRTGCQFRLDVMRELLSFGAPFVPGSLFFFIVNNGDRFFLQKLVDSSAVGVYSLGYKVGSLVGTLVLGAFIKVWAPYMFDLHKESRNRKGFGRLFLDVTTIYSVLALCVAMFSKETIYLVFGSNYIESHQVVPYILIAYLFYTAAAFFDSGFYLTGKTIYKPIIMGVSAILVVILYWKLIPRYGLLGAAYATMICYAAFSVLTYFVSGRIYPVEYPLAKFASVFVVGSALYCFGMILPWQHTLAGLIVKSLIVICYPFILVMLGIFEQKDVDSVKSLIQRIKKKAISDHISSQI